MTFRKFLAASAVSAGLLLALPAAAQTGLRAGATVTDPQGGEVGTIVSIDGDHLILRTDRHEIRLPAASFTATDEAVLFALSRDELNASVEQALAQAQQAIEVGVVVYDRDGAEIGAVQAADEQMVTVGLGDAAIRIPRTSFAPGENGPIVGLTVAELRAQVAAAQASN